MRGVLVAALSLACLAAPGEPAERADSRARPATGERVPMVAVVLSPGRDRAQLPVSSVLDAAARAIEAASGVEVRSAEQAGTDAEAFLRCPPAERLTCWLRAARADRAPPSARFVLVLSVLARSGEPDLLSAQLIDVEAALGALRGARDGDEAEDLIQINAVYATAGPSAVAGVDALERWIDALVEDTLRGPLSRRGQWAVLGRLRISADRPLTVELDGRPQGAVEAGDTVLTGVRAGARTLVLRDPARAAEDPEASVRYPLEVVAGAEALALVVWPSGVGAATRGVTWWGGLATAAVGASLVVWAAAASPSARTVVPCVGADCEGPRPRLWDDTCTLTRDDPASCGDQRGVRVAPLGGALVLAGGAWAAGSTLGDPDETPWIGWLAGAALGALAYGVAIAAE